jgi:hypothetical protein
MTTNQDRAAEALGRERYSRSLQSAPGVLGRFIEHSRPDAQALADAGLLAPDLPTDDTVGMSSGEWSAGFDYEDDEENTYPAHAYAESPGVIGISAPRAMDTEDAEALALAILAAVRSDRQIATHATQEKK